MLKFLLKFLKDYGGLLVSFVAVVVSFTALRLGYRDSYLSHRAYVAPATWGISDNQTQFQFKVFNAGQTPGIQVSANGEFKVGSKMVDAEDLLNGKTVTVYQNTSPETYPAFIWVFKPEDFQKMKDSEGNEAILTIRYKDYEGKDRTTTTSFVLASPAPGKYQLQQVSQVLK